MNNFDILTKTPSLYVYGNRTFRTCHAIYLSIVFLITVGAACIFLAVEIMTSDPITRFNRIKNNNSSLDVTELPFIFKLTSNDGMTELEPGLAQLIFTEAWTSKRCNISSDFGKNREIFENWDKSNPENNKISTYQCLVPLNRPVTLKKKFGEIGSYSPSFEFHKCINGTFFVSKNKCKDDVEVNNRLQSVYLRIAMFDYEINVLNFTHPISPVIKTELLPMSRTIYKRYFLYLRNVKLVSDVGWIMSQMEEIDFFQTEKIDISVDLRDYANGKFGMFSFNSFDFEESYYRVYPKIQLLFGQIGGVISLCTTFFTFISNFLTDKMFKFKIINDFFTFEAKNQENVYVNSAINLVTIPQKNTKKEKIKKSQGRISLREFICCSSMKEKKDYLKAEKITKSQLSIDKLIHILLELDSMKSFLKGVNNTNVHKSLITKPGLFHISEFSENNVYIGANRLERLDGVNGVDGVDGVKG